MKESFPSAVHNAFFFAGALLGSISCAAVSIFALGQYERKWSPPEGLHVETLGSVVVMGTAAILFVVPTVLASRHAKVKWGVCAMLGVAYAVSLWLVVGFLRAILDPEGWPFVISTWAFLLGAPIFLGLFMSRPKAQEQSASTVPNTAAHPDARGASHLDQPSRPRAGGRER
jgi:hypothetical protein